MVLYSLVAVVGATMDLGLLWSIAETFNGLMSIPNLIALFLLSGTVVKLVKEYFKKCGIFLVDFKLQFGITKDNELVLADEISPDTCRLWDINSGERLDKDRFRKDLGDIVKSYEEVYNRLISIKE